jgi:hypothetical protein
MAITVDVVNWQAEEFKSLHHEFDLSLNAELKFDVVGLQIQEVVIRFLDFETAEPVVEKFVYHKFLTQLFL